jgi:hypothetical protein
MSLKPQPPDDASAELLAANLSGTEEDFISRNHEAIDVLLAEADHAVEQGDVIDADGLQAAIVAQRRQRLDRR